MTNRYQTTKAGLNAPVVKAIIIENNSTSAPITGAVTIVDPLGVEVDLASSLNQTDGSQKAQSVDAAGVSSDPIYRVFAITVTRPANVTAYTAGDVIGDVSAALSQFADVAKAAGYGVVVSNIRLQTNDTGLASKVVNVHFYNDTVTAIADNAAFSIVDADASKRVGSIQLTFGAGIYGKEASAQFENLIIVPVTRNIPIIMETVATYTPSANSTWIRVEIGVILGN